MHCPLLCRDHGSRPLLTFEQSQAYNGCHVSMAEYGKAKSNSRGVCLLSFHQGYCHFAVVYSLFNGPLLSNAMFAIIRVRSVTSSISRRLDFLLISTG